MSRFNLCDCPAGFSAAPERHAPDCPGRSGAGKPRAAEIQEIGAPAHPTCDAAIDQVALGLMQELAKLRKDAERLNWLDGRVKPVVENQNWGQPEGELVGYDWSVFGQCSSVRDAIDDAMSKEPSNG